MKKTFKRIAAALLVAVMLFGSAPLESLTGIDFGGLFELEAEAASYTIKGKNTVNIPIGEYIHKGPVYRDANGYGNCWAFAQMVYQKVWGTSFTSYRNTNDDMLRNVTGGAARKVTAENAKKFISFAAPGAVIRMCGEYIEGSDGTNGGKTTTMHSVVLVSKDDKGCVIYDSNVNYGSSKNPDYRTRLRYYTWKEFVDSFGNCKYFKYIKWPRANPYTVSITLADADKISNTSAVISGKLNHGINIQKIAYYLSTDETIVSLDGTNSKNHKDTKVIDFIVDKDYSSNTKGMNSFKITVDEYLKKDLTPDTKYYYKVLIKAGNKWFQSPVGYFVTTDNEPKTTKFAETDYDIGINDVVTVSWGVSAYATSYRIDLYSNNNLVYSKDNILGTTLAFPGDCFSTPGTYYARLTAKNENIEKQMDSEAVINVNYNKYVTFVDSLTGETISQQEVVYGHDATAPATPTPYGYTFTKWSADFTNVTEPLTVWAEYKKNIYTVKFVDGMTGKTLDTQKVEYLSAATDPEVTAPEGYTFKGWDVPFDSVKEDITVTAVYEWYDEDYPVIANIVSAKRHSTKDGYNVEVEVYAGGDKEIVQGRLVIAVKSETGYQFVETESQAFSLTAGETKTITTYVPCLKLAHSVYVYTINSYDNAGPIAQPVSAEINYGTSGWSEWIEYTGDEAPVEGMEGVDYELKTTEPLYRSRTRSESLSESASVSGWTQYDSYWQYQSTKTLDYVKSWPSGFNKSHSLYKTYNVTPKTNLDTATTKTEIVSDKASGYYIYWHWCRGRVLDKQYNSLIADGKEGDFDTFHAFKSNKLVSEQYDGAKYCTFVDSDNCLDSYFWWYAPITIRRQTYKTYKKIYKFYQWSEWSEWSSTPVEAVENKVDVEVQPGKKYYRVYTESIEASKLVVDAEQTVNIKGYVDSQYAGKDVTVYVYKYGRVSDYTNEFIGTTADGKVGADGLIEISNAQLRECPSDKTGDFKVVASIKGNTGVVELTNLENPEQFEAPKKTFLVNYYDFDKETVIYYEYVEEGGSVTAPDGIETNPDEGYKFTSWSQSTVNVHDNLDVYPNQEKKTFVLVFVDWGQLKVTMYEDMPYGSKIVFPAAESADGKEVEWDTSFLTADENGDYLLTDNTVITTKYTDKTYTITYIADGKEENYVSEQESGDGMSAPPVIDDGDVEETENPGHGEHTDPPVTEKEESPDYIFCGWRNLKTGEYLIDTVVEEDATYYPVYKFVNTTETPVADIKTGEYFETQYVTLSCTTEEADIYYTLDGSDPTDPDNTSAVKYNGNPIEVSESCVLTYYAVSLSANDSEIGSELYAINSEENAVSYYIVTVENNLPYKGTSSDSSDCCYQTMVKNGIVLPDLSEFENVEGYVFNGLYYDSEFTAPFEYESEPICESMILYASYTPLQYTATFKKDDGTVISTSTVDYGTSAQVPAEPEKIGYKFVGWSSDDYLNMTKDCEITAVFVSVLEWATINILPPQKSGFVGNGTTLSYTVTPIYHTWQDITWESSDESVATVDCYGKVSYVGVGTAVITATIDSSRESDECKITVMVNRNENIVIGSRSYLGVDSAGNIRGIKAGTNTVAEIKEQFDNEKSDLIFVTANGVELGENDLVGTGTVVKLYVGGKVYDEKVMIMSGDVNSDGYINNKDSSVVARYNVDKETPNDYQMLAMDVNGDGYVNNRDTAMISRYNVGKETF